MTNLTQIIILLQAVLGLLSNPQTASLPAVQNLASEALQTAQLALASSTAPIAVTPTTTVQVTPPIDYTQPVTVQVQNTPTPSPIGAPDLGSVQTVPVTVAVPPTCTISFQPEPDAQGTITWTSNVTAPFTALLSDQEQSSFYNSGQWTYSWPTSWESVSVPSQYQTSTVTNAPQTSFGSTVSSEYWAYHVGIDNSSPVQLRLQIGGATCTTIIPPQSFVK